MTSFSGPELRKLIIQTQHLPVWHTNQQNVRDEIDSEKKGIDWHQSSVLEGK